MILRLCYRILGRMDEAEDAAQETFVLAYRALGSYRADGPPGAWLARIATRVCWRRSATLARRRAATTSFDDVLAATLAGPDDPRRSGGGRRGRRPRYAEPWRLLPEPYREVIALRFLADLSTADIAAATGRPEATVRTQLRRGLERMRALMTRGDR